MVIVYWYVLENEELIFLNIEINIVVLYLLLVCVFFVFNVVLSFNWLWKIYGRKFSSLKIIYGNFLIKECLYKILLY